MRPTFNDFAPAASTTRARTTTRPTSCAGCRASSGSRARAPRTRSRRSRRARTRSSSCGRTRPTSPRGSTHFAQVPAYYDANGHYARVLPIFNALLVRPEREPARTRSARQSASVRATARRQPLLPGRGHAARAGRLEPVHRRRQADRRRLRPGRGRPAREAASPEAAAPDRARRRRRADRARRRSRRRATTTAATTRCARSSTTPRS